MQTTPEDKGTSTKNGSTERDMATGQASDKRQHEPIVIRQQNGSGDRKAGGEANASQATHAIGASRFPIFVSIFDFLPTSQAEEILEEAEANLSEHGFRVELHAFDAHSTVA